MSNIHNGPTKAQMKATLYFGRQCPNGAYVSDALFDKFLSESVTPQYPGFTLLHATDYWKGKSENATLLILLLDDDTNARNAVRIIAEQYKTRFAQEAVAYSFEACQFTLDCWPHGPVGAYHRHSLLEFPLARSQWSRET